MIKAVIIDDEEHAREDLLYMLKKHCPGITVSGQANNINTGAEIIKSLKPEVIFLDIQMPMGSGFDLLTKFPEMPFEVIFVTAYDEYAIKALRFSALDYLLKPVRPEELKEAISRLEFKKSNSKARTNFLAEHTGKKKEFNEIVLPGKHGLEIIMINDIIRCEASSNYTSFILKNDKKILVAKTLKEFDELLSPHNFMRIHKSHLINMKYVKAYSKNKGGVVTMSDGSEIELARRKKEIFLERLNIS